MHQIHTRATAAAAISVVVTQPRAFSVWAEDPVNCKRDEKLVENMFALWNGAGRNRAAILNAGSSHQFRIARMLPPEVNYYHIEQP